MCSSDLLAAKVNAGEISAATAIALHPVVTAPPDRATRADVDQLVQMCVGASPNDARRAAEVWKDGHRSATAEELAVERHAKRAVRFGAEVDGMIRTTADLPTLQAHLLRKALTSFGGRPSDDDRRTTDQRLADALIALVDRSLGWQRNRGAPPSPRPIKPRQFLTIFSGKVYCPDWRGNPASQRIGW